MNESTPLLLAIDIGDLIGIIIFILFAAAGVVGNLAKNKGKTSKGQTSAGNRGGRQRLDELAARRRRELQELARQRQQQQPQARAGGGSARQYGGQPENLTMSERIARARAKEQYEQRASELRQQTEADELSQPVEARRIEQQRAAEAKRQAQARAQQQAQRQAQARAQQQQAAQLQRQQQLQQRRQRLDAERAAEERQRKQSHRRQPKRRKAIMGDALQVTRPTTRGGVELPPINRQSLRSAFVMKEILDAPVSQRKQTSEIGG